MIIGIVIVLILFAEHKEFRKDLVVMMKEKKGTIRVGALDCGVEPTNASNPYAIRKVCYSSNGPMINIWALAKKL